MSLNLHLPRIAGHGRHRGKTPMQLRVALDAETARANELQHLLDTAGIELSGERLARQAAEETAEELAGELAAQVEEITRLRAALANASAVTVAEWVRVVDEPIDVATQPIPAGDMWNDTAAGWRADRDHVVVALPDAVDADTQEIPRPHAA